MKKSSKILLALATLWPICYIFIFMALMITMMAFMAAHADQSNGPPTWFLALFVLHLLTIFETLALIAFYIYHLFKTSRVPQDKKALWAVVIFFGNMLAMPVYFYFYIWKDPPQPPPLGENPPSPTA